MKWPVITGTATVATTNAAKRTFHVPARKGIVERDSLEVTLTLTPNMLMLPASPASA